MSVSVDRIVNAADGGALAGFGWVGPALGGAGLHYFEALGPLRVALEDPQIVPGRGVTICVTCCVADRAGGDPAIPLGALSPAGQSARMCAGHVRRA